MAREALTAAAVDSEPARLAATPLGNVCEETNRNADVVRHYWAAAESSRRVLGDSAEATLDSLGDLVRALTAQGATTVAFELAADLLERRRETWGEYHWETVDIKKNLAMIYPALGFWPEAELVQRDVLRIVEAEQPPGSEEVCFLVEALVESCSKQGRYDEDEAFGRRAMELQLDNVGPDGMESRGVCLGPGMCSSRAERLRNWGWPDRADRVNIEPCFHY